MMIFLLLMTGICTYTDLKKRIIPNQVVLILFMAGLLCNILGGTMQYILLSLLMLAILWPLGVGGGDKKLISVMPLWLQENTAVFAFFLSIICLVLYFVKNIQKPVAFAPGILIALILTIIVTHFTGI